MGLNAFEYQCGRGVRISAERAAALGKACAEKGIALSVHAPYYISMSSLEEEKRLRSVDYLLESCAAVKAMGGRRVIFHAGSCGKQSREEALEKALDTMRRAVDAVDAARLWRLCALPRDDGQGKPARHAGRGACALRGRCADHPLH